MNINYIANHLNALITECKDHITLYYSIYK